MPDVDDEIPFWSLYDPMATLLLQHRRQLRRKVNDIVRHIAANKHRPSTPPLLRSLRTAAGTVEMRTSGHGSISTSLIASPKVKFAQREIVLFDTLMPDTVIAACIGRTLRDVVDMGPNFPARDAAIVNGRRVVSSTRLALDVPLATLRHRDIAGGR